MFCPHCGKKIEVHSDYCKHCGNQASDEKEIAVAQSETFSKTVVASGKSGMQAKHLISIVVGTILAIGGLTLAIIHKELALAMVGRGQIARDLFTGGTTYRDAAAVVLMIGVIALIVGSLFVILGLVSGLKRK